MRVAVVGVGLIGGSIALAARERLAADVAGFDRSQEAIQGALDRGALTQACASVAEAVAGAQAVFVAVPVGVLVPVVADALSGAPQDCVVTDVGSSTPGRTCSTARPGT
jgi:prephenate dehydrogenase